MPFQCLPLDDRAVLRLSGPETRPFLDGLITNDVPQADDTHAVYAGLLTPQGKVLFDLILLSDGADLLLDAEAARLDDLIRKLTLYKLRAEVDIVDERDRMRVCALWDEGTSGTDSAVGGLTVTDPRAAALGKRWYGPKDSQPAGTALTRGTYDAKRLSLGIPSGSSELKTEKDFWLETNAEVLNGVSFEKGCYVGQELTARMKHRTSLKKCLVPMVPQGGMPSPGAAIVTAEGKAAGDVRAAADGAVLALLRLEHREAELNADGIALRPSL